MNHRSFPFAWAWLADSRFATGPSRRVPWPTPPPVTGLVFGARAAPRPGLRSRGGRLFWVAGVTGLTLRGDVELFARKRGAALPSRSRTAGAPGTRVCAPPGGGALRRGGPRHPGRTPASLPRPGDAVRPGPSVFSLTRENFTRTSAETGSRSQAARDFPTPQLVLYFSRCPWRPETPAVRSPNSFGEHPRLPTPSFPGTDPQRACPRFSPKRIETLPFAFAFVPGGPGLRGPGAG